MDEHKLQRQSFRFLEIALLVGLIVGAGTTYALTPFIADMLGTTTTKTGSNPVTATTTVTSMVLSTLANKPSNVSARTTVTPTSTPTYTSMRPGTNMTTT